MRKLFNRIIAVFNPGISRGQEKANCVAWRGLSDVVKRCVDEKFASESFDLEIKFSAFICAILDIDFDALNFETLLYYG